VSRKITVLANLLLVSLLLAGCATTKAVMVAPKSVPIPPAPPPHAEPPAFAGLSADALRARLGTPAFSSKVGATDMWRYDSKTCHAFFFLTGGQVNHIETIPRAADAAADPACLNALKKIS
jgi:outer membrane protein assembly factor BamE (lipoprotein component of BamABCDE complex)